MGYSTGLLEYNDTPLLEASVLSNPTFDTDITGLDGGRLGRGDFDSDL